MTPKRCEALPVRAASNTLLPISSANSFMHAGRLEVLCLRSETPPLEKEEDKVENLAVHPIMFHV